MHLAGCRNTARRLQECAEQEPAVYQDTNGASELPQNEGTHANNGSGPQSGKGRASNKYSCPIHRPKGKSKSNQSNLKLTHISCMQKIDVNYILTQHDLLTKDTAAQLLPDNTVIMTTLVYYYLIEKQFTNLFQLLNETKNMEL